MNREIGLRATLDRRDTPLEMLERAAQERASGELVIASECFEVHVCLLEGRIAWAMSTRTRSAFAKHLVEHGGLDREVLHEMVAKSRGSRARLYETLISSGRASREAVRTALLSQIRSTLSELAAIEACSALFLPRHREYDRALTFALTDVAQEQSALADAPEKTLSIQASDVMEMFPNAAWGSVFIRDRLASSTSRCMKAHALLSELNALLEGHCLRSLVLRSAYGNVLGVRDLPRQCSLWVALPPDARLGVSLTLLGSVTSSPPPLHVTFSASLEVKPLGQFIEGIALAPMRHALKSADLMLAAFVTNTRGEVCGVARHGLSPGPMTNLAGAAESLLAVESLDIFGNGTNLHDLSDERLGLCIDAGPFVLYQTRLSNPELTLSIAFECSGAAGLGWALLGTLARQLDE